MKRLFVKILLCVGLGSLLFALPVVVVPLRSVVLDIETEEVSSAQPPPTPFKEALPVSLEYRPDIGSGNIGVPVRGQVDEAYDNVFIVDINELPSDNDVVWLTYELSGAPDHDAVPRSINDQRSTGGRLLRRSTGWHPQRERISPKSLRADRNVIRFGTYDPSLQHYALRGLRVVVEKNAAIGEPEVIITNASDTLFAGTAFIKGFVRGVEAVEVSIGGQVVQVDNGSFETVLDLGGNVEAHEVVVSVRSTDGSLVTRTVSLGPSVDEELRVFDGATTPTVSSPFIPGIAFQIACGDARLELDGACATTPLDIEVRHLRSVDLPPMPGDLVNVVPNGGGYRFLPDGVRFSAPARLTMAYDTELIPIGYTAADVRAYYFDENTRNWIQVPPDTLIVAARALRSTTTHFTDYINGVIKVPEAPETMGYQPTSIKDLKIGDASAGLTPLVLPEASSTGAMSTRFPLKLPPGRQGMQPDLSLLYSSEGGHSWTGLGWNLSGVSQITIDTRWGVPRYDPDLETETYVMDGEMLTPVAHRSEWVTRTGSATDPKIFHPRVEGSFRQIKRFGSDPTSYRWEITAKDGTVNYYGSAPGVASTARLTDPDGNIARWGLVRVRDTNGNTVDYKYDEVTHSGTPGSGGKQLYLAQVRYTGHVPSSDPGKFSVTFHRDPDPARPDININARLGLVEVTAHRLDSIVVRYEDEVVRSYRLRYQIGAFRKSLLRAIIERDKDGEEFYRHEYEYFDEVSDDQGYSPYEEPQDWISSGAVPGGPLFNPTTLLRNEPSLIGGSTSRSYTFGGAITVGWWDNRPYSKQNSIGGNYSRTLGKNEGLTSLIDIDGDNLPDQVFKDDDGLRYCRNQFGTGAPSPFGPMLPLGGSTIPALSQGRSRTSTKGLEAHPGNFFLGLSWTKSESETKTYITDRNGDGLMDFAKDGVVYFNRQVDGVPTFGLDPSNTPNPVEGGVIDQSLFQLPEGYLETLINENPLHDVVRVWMAPYDGSVTIIGSIDLLASNDPEPYEHADGVKLWVQRNGDVLWSDSLLSPGWLAGPVITTEVEKGDRFYFRLGSRFDGARDRVSWNPHITYLNVSDPGFSDEVDPNGLGLKHYQAESDFLLAASQSVVMPLAGTVAISGLIDKPVLSDDVTFWWTRLDTVNGSVPDTTRLFVPWSTPLVGDASMEQGAIHVDAGTELKFHVSSATNVDWQKVIWSPRVVYTAADSANIEVQDDEAEYLFDYTATVSMSTFDHVHASWNEFFNTSGPAYPSRVVIAADTGLLSLRIVGNLNIYDLEDSTDVTLSLKGPDRLYGKHVYPFYDGYLHGINDDGFQASVVQGDSLWAEIHIGEHEVADTLNSIVIDVEISDGFDAVGSDSTAAQLEERLGVHTRTADDDVVFGPMYRGWGRFIYRANDQDAPIDESILTLENMTTGDPAGDLGSLESPGDIDEDGLSALDPSQAKVIYMVADAVRKVWQGLDEFTYIARDSLSSSRLGEDDLNFAVPGSIPDVIPAPFRRSTSTTFGQSGNFGLSAGTISLGLGYGNSDGTDVVDVDVSDMNGDRYPDIIISDRIQYTDPRGAMHATVLTTEFEQRTSTHADGPTSSGSVPVPKQTSGTQPPGSGDNMTALEFFGFNMAADGGERTSRVCIGLNGSASEGDDDLKTTLVDMNGDGLPDRLDATADAITVGLNLGYGFANMEAWNIADIRGSESADHGLGLGVSLYNGSVSAGIGSSWTSASARRALVDLNGDGLPDLVEATGDEVEQVRLNQGDGFSSPIQWTCPAQLDATYSAGESVNAGFTVCVPLLLVAKVCFNPSGSTGWGISQPETQFIDINGDGFVDHITSDNRSSMVVRLSTIGRTNLLKKVNGPIGSSFEVDYALTGNTYDLPQGKWVMSRLATFDGFSDNPNGVGDSTLTTFSYAGGKYSRREREFYGFGEVESRDHFTGGDQAVYRRTTRTYNVDDYYRKGLLLSSELHDADDVLWKRSTNQYELRPPGFDPLDDAASAFPALITTLESSFEGGAGPLARSMTFDYDVRGNVTSYADLDLQSNDPVLVTISYHDPLPGYISATPRAQTIAVDGVIRRERRQEQDASGNITSIEQKIDEETWARHEFGYDDYGNLTSMQRPANHLGQSLAYTYEYDPAVRTHVSRVTDSYGYTSSSTYFPEFGQMESATDMNGEMTEYTVDGRGRVDTVIAPYERELNRPTITVSYNTDAVPAYAVVNHHNEDTDSDIQTVTFIDGLFRPVQVKKTGVFFNASNGAETVMPIVSGRTLYDDFGRIAEQRYPLFWAQDSIHEYTDDIDAVPPTKTTYDVLDRPLTVRLPDQSVTTTTYAIVDDNGSQALRSRMIDAEGNKKDQISDVRGNERARVDYLGNEAITTRSLINGIGELQQVMDVGSNVTAYTYDMLGRKLTYDHPDGGLTSFTYDPAGNLTHKLSANLLTAYGDTSGAVKYTYEYERLRRIDYPDNFQNQVFYDYGAPGDEHGRAGRIWRQMDASGGQEFFYGPLGEVVKNIRTIIINQAQVHTYVWQQRYDSWNRVQEMAYPDGEIVDYEYNAAGKLRAMTGEKGGQQYPIIDRMGYDQFAQRVYMKQGNGAETRYRYETDRRRLDTLLVDIHPEGLAPRTIMRNDYAYDQVNNILALTNDAPLADGQLGGTMSAEYQYDSLYRLVDAQATYIGNVRSDSYALQMEYDNLHNIVQKAQQDTTNMLTKPRVNHDLAYVYADEQERPHVPSRIGTRTYGYDANGNLTSWAEDHPTYLSRDFHWDEENRLKAIRHNGEMNFYTYDAAGERAMKSHGGMQAVYMNGAPVGLINHDRNWTAYVSPYLVVTERGFTKHYYIEGQRVASRIGSGQFVFGPNSMPGLQAGNWDYHHRIQQLQNAQNGHANAQQENAHQHLTLPRPSGQNPYGTIATAPAELPDGYGWSNVWGQMQITHPTLPPSNPPTTSPVISSASATAGYGYGLGGNSQEVNQYFYHPDHLGSATYVTGRDGRVRQHIEYTAFGETFVEEHTSSDTQPYLYNGKELDSETGLYYYGARYYDPVASIWASVDPMAEKYAGMTPFAYGLQNPIRYSDPDGMDALETVSNLSVGFADAMTFGLTSKFNKYVMGTGDYTNTQSDAYKLGDAIGTAFNVVLSAGGKAVGEKALGITIEAAATAVNAGIEMKEGNLRPTEFIVNKVAEKGFEKVGGLAVKDIDAAKITDFGKKFVEKATGAYVDKFMNGVMPSKNDDKREFEKRLKQIGDPTPPSVRPIE